jgi:hypothetical protein
VGFYRTERIAQTLLEHTFNDQGECVCGFVGLSPLAAAQHVAEHVDVELAEEWR